MNRYSDDKQVEEKWVYQVLNSKKESSDDDFSVD